MAIIDKRMPIFILMWQHRLGSDYLGTFSSKNQAKKWAAKFSKEKGYNNSYVIKDYMNEPVYQEGI